MADTNLIYPYEFEGGKKAVANEVNANFEAVKSFANGINVSINEIYAAINDLKNKIKESNVFNVTILNTEDTTASYITSITFNG